MQPEAISRYVPSDRTIHAAQAVRAKAAPWHRARYFPPAAIPRTELRADLPRKLRPMERDVLAVVRASLGAGFPGLNASVSDLAEMFDREPRTIQRALDGLGEHHRPCEGPCRLPGTRKVKRAGELVDEPLCRGCHRPCEVGCTEHLYLVRRVHQFIHLTWRRPGAAFDFKRRQCASTLLLGTNARKATPRKGGCAGEKNVTPKPSLSLSPTGREERENGTQNGRGKVPACAGGRSTRPTRSGRASTTTRALPAAPEGPRRQGADGTLPRMPERSPGELDDLARMLAAYEAGERPAVVPAPVVAPLPERPPSDAEPDELAQLAAGLADRLGARRRWQS